MRSFWERNSLLDCDIAIVGAGITGLSMACAILERKPQTKVLVLERSLLPTGASTRNAGFASFGSLTEILGDEQKMGQDACIALIEKRWKGLQKLMARLGKETIDFQPNGGYELLADQSAASLKDEMRRWNGLLKDIFAGEVYADHSHKIGAFGFAQTQGLLYNHFEGQIDTGKMMGALWQYTQARGARIITGAEVSRMTHTTQGIELHTNPDFVFRAGKVIVCTNAFAKQLFPQVALNIGRGQVIMTKPLPTPVRFQGTFHMEAGFYYFRNFENRVLFGGGRHKDLATETTVEFALTERIQQDLEEKLRTVILPNQPFEIDMRWAGIMAFSDDKLPINELVAPDTWLIARMNGLGVALASQLTEEVAEELF